MTSSHWELVTRIFEAALDTPLVARAEFVRNRCGGDVTLESEVMKLLAANELAGSFLERPALEKILSPLSGDDKSSRLSPGIVVSDRFEIIRFIGQGGMGQVYEALDLELKGRIALKAIRPEISSNPQVLSRFRREVQLTRRITHPNVCRTFDIERHAGKENGIDAEITFLTMELLEGETLADLLRRQQRLTTSETLPLVIQMIEALSAAHNVGIVHRDFKPSNVLLVPSTAGLRVVVTDFGLARAILPDGELSAEQHSSPLTNSEGLLGTLVYMAPEQLERGEATPASDIYSLGLVMFEMITGQRPFADPIPFSEALKRIKQAAPSPRIHNPDLAPEWEAIICQCLQLNPEARPESVQQVIQTINASKWKTPKSKIALFGESHDGGASNGQLDILRNARWPRWVVGIGLVIAAVSLFATVLRYHEWRARVPDGASVLLTEVANQTSDQELDAVTDVLRHELNQSAHFNMIERSKVREILTQMGRPYQQQLEPTTVREIAWRQGGALVVYGSITDVGPALSLDLRLERLGREPDKSPRSWNKSFQANDKHDLFNAIQAGSQWIRAMAGENPDLFANEKLPQDTTTSSWEALLFFSQAEQLKALDHTPDAIERLEQAVRIDPDFALAWMRLGDLSNYIERDSDGFKYWQRALESMGRRSLTKKEELRIRGLYSADTGEHATAREMFQEWEVLYPKDYFPSFYLAGSLIAVGRYEEAIEKLNEAERKQPSAWYIVARRARCNLSIGKYDRLAKDLERLRELGQSETADLLEGAQQFISGDGEMALEKLGHLASSPDAYWRSIGYSVVASLLSELGRYDEARKQLDLGISFDQSDSRLGALADKEIAIAYLAYRSGDRHTCKSRSLAAVRYENGQSHLESAGTLLARCGFGRDAKNMELQLKDMPDGPIFQVARHRIAGEVLLSEGSSDQALMEFQAASVIDDSGNPREYLARALLSAGQKDQALKIYRNIVEHPGQIWQEPDLQFPGLWADALFQDGRLEHSIYGDDSRLRNYMAVRANADSVFQETKLARSLVGTN
jgi:eukaryotic-like serine/threonine-protein kinase